MKAHIVRWWRRASSRQRRANALILMYHRFADGLTDPWELCVSPKHFAEHLALLSARYRVIPLTQLVSELAAGTIAPRTVAITIDDGYADNFLAGAPLLARNDIPATLFVSTSQIGGAREFWWDELERLFLSPGTLPATCIINVAGAEHRWDVGGAAPYEVGEAKRHCTWRASLPPPTIRHAVFLEVWRLLYSLSAIERTAVIEELCQWANDTGKVRDSHRAMTMEELVNLPRRAPLSVGAHGVTHIALDCSDETTQLREIAGSRDWLQQMLGAPVTTFAYPHGANDDRTRAIIRELGFVAACTTREGGVSSDDVTEALPRLQVRDWGADDLEQHLLWWLGA